MFSDTGFEIGLSSDSGSSFLLSLLDFGKVTVNFCLFCKREEVSPTSQSCQQDLEGHNACQSCGHSLAPCEREMNGALKNHTIQRSTAGLEATKGQHPGTPNSRQPGRSKQPAPPHCPAWLPSFALTWATRRLIWGAAGCRPAAGRSNLACSRLPPAQRDQASLEEGCNHRCVSAV